MRCDLLCRVPRFPSRTIGAIEETELELFAPRAKIAEIDAALAIVPLQERHYESTVSFARRKELPNIMAVKERKQSNR